MLTLNNKFLGAEVMADETGKVSVAFKVPGTYDGLSPKFELIDGSNCLMNGRLLSSIRVMPKVFKYGDAVTDITVIDLDEIIPVEDRSAYSDYPILRSTADTAMLGISGIAYMPATGFLLDRGTNAVFLPSGLYLQIRMQKYNPSELDKTFFITVSWFSEE